MSDGRRSRPSRVGDLLPEAARQLGLDAELRLARAIATWDALVAERLPPAVGACRLVRIDGAELVVEVDEPIVASELRLRAIELLEAMRTARLGVELRTMRLVNRTGREAGSGRPPRL